MVEELRDTLNWAYKFNKKLKSPTWDVPHDIHMKDMLNVIEQIHDGTFDEDLIKLSKRVDNIEKISRKKKLADPLDEGEAQVYEEFTPTFSNPYLKKIPKTIYRKNKGPIKGKVNIACSNVTQPVTNAIDLFKNNLSGQRKVYLQHTKAANTSIIPLNATYMSPVNISPCENIPNHFDTNRKFILPNSSKNFTSLKPYVPKIPKDNILLTNKEQSFDRKIRNGRLKKSATNVTAIATENPVDCTDISKKNSSQANMEYYANRSWNSNENDFNTINTPNDHSEMRERHFHIPSPIETTPAALYAGASKVTSSSAFIHPIDNDVRYGPTKLSQGCQTQPDSMVDVRKILNLYNISIDPEFMEEELERFSLRLYERINYYIEKEDISIDIDQQLQQLYSNRNEQAERNDDQTELSIDLEQDSCNSYQPNEILNDSPSCISEGLLDSIVNAFKNTSFHEIAKKELLAKNGSRKIHKPVTHGEENGTSGLPTMSHVPESDERQIENTEPSSKTPLPHSYSVSETNQASARYSEDFASTSNSTAQTGSNKTSAPVDVSVGPQSTSIGTREDISVRLQSRSDDAVLDISCDLAPPVDTSAINDHVEIARKDSNASSSSQSKPASRIVETDPNFEVSESLDAERFSISLQKDSITFSDGELLINLSDSIDLKEKVVHVPGENACSRIALSDSNDSVLSVVANDSGSFETGNIQIEPGCLDADVTLSSGEMVQVYSPMPQFKSEEMFQLFHENERLRQRLAHLRRTS